MSGYHGEDAPWGPEIRRLEKRIAALEAAANPPQEERSDPLGPDQPIPLLLFCPTCGVQHLDAPAGDWTNPPHRSHLCGACGCIWRPADVPTEGVASITTKGSGDTWAAAPDMTCVAGPAWEWNRGPHVCACGAVGFKPSVISGQCEFCDGTEAGVGPAHGEP